MPYQGPYPRFHFPLKLIHKIVISALLKKTRSFQKDSHTALLGNPFIKYSGKTNIPDQDSFLLTMNHYSRPGFLIIWAAMAIAVTLNQPMIWVMTRAWTNRSGGLDAVWSWLSSCMLKRLAEIYGFVTMPPMPPDPAEQTERAISVRNIMQAVRTQADAVLCLSPEGRNFPEGNLGAPPPGTGKFLAYLSNYYCQILPVGVYEQDGQLVVQFGTPYALRAVLKPHDSDDQIAWRVMQQIAMCLPESTNKIYPFPQEEN
jgi:hypothetical protein